MSTPNTSLVKWVEQDELNAYTKDEIESYGEIAIPVIPLADLTELVEGLEAVRDNAIAGPLVDEWGKDPASDRVTFHAWLAQRLLVQLEAHRKEG